LIGVAACRRCARTSAKETWAAAGVVGIRGSTRGIDGGAGGGGGGGGGGMSCEYE
jgi:hypothetical protein